MSPAARPENWFLGFTSMDPAGPAGDGRPWGDGTEMAARAKAPQPVDPWDEGCRVTTYTSGFDAMSAIRDVLECVISDAEASLEPVGRRGHVYLSGWRLNALRDLSVDNSWMLDPWPANPANTPATLDQTVVGLVLRLLAAGVRVRLMLWLPKVGGEVFAGYAEHVLDHDYLSRVVGAVTPPVPAGEAPLGVVALDLRTAPREAASHHQKTIVVRSGKKHVAFVGGVDLAFTRRDTPGTPPGDWQSAGGAPPLSGWPHQQRGVDYTNVEKVTAPNTVQPSDLPEAVYGMSRHRWHDQHLKLEGPIVTTLEWQFVERWRESGRTFGPDRRRNWSSQQVIFSSTDALEPAGQDGIKPLPLPRKAPDLGITTTAVQMWRTIPLRPARTGPPFVRGEFTVLAGVAHAVRTAEQLIWVFDQYMWSQAFGRLVNQQLKARPHLHVLVVLPPYADALESVAHEARRRTLAAMTAGAADRVAVYDLWEDPGAPPRSPTNRGIYVHAKSHTYDGALLVCGSANVNRRSFLCDTELVCAVLDPGVVRDHQDQLWQLLFDADLPAHIDLQTAGGGKQLFDAFVAAAGQSSILVPDPWAAADPQLPNGVPVPRSPWLCDRLYSWLLDPSSVTGALEGDVRDAAAIPVSPSLHDLYVRLEQVHSASGRFPFRRPA